MRFLPLCPHAYSNLNLSPPLSAPPTPPFQDLVELAADSLLPLLMAEGETFSAICSSLAGSQSDPAVASRVAQALSRLVPSGVVLQSQAGGRASPEPTRQTRRLFRQGLSMTVNEVRSLIRMK